MRVLYRLFGRPHEMLHVLALRLIGQRPQAVTRLYVDLPDDLSTGQFVFVAGLPALMFWGVTAVSAAFLLKAGDVAQVVLWLLLTLLAGTAAVSTFGDIALIIARLLQNRLPPDETE